MNNPRTRIALIILVLSAILIATVFAVLRLQPKADVSAEPIYIVWGKVTDSNNTSLPNVLIQAGSVSTVSEEQGGFILEFSEVNSYPLRFLNMKTGQKYELANAWDQQLIVGKGPNQKHDFQIQPLSE